MEESGAVGCVCCFAKIILCYWRTREVSQMGEFM